MLRSLPLGTRLLLSLAIAALLPVILFGLVAVLEANASVRSAQESSLLTLARVASADISTEGLDAAGARQVALETGARVTILAVDGTVLGASDSSAAATLPPGYDAARAPIVTSAEGMATAFVPVAGPGGSPAAIVAFTQPAASTPQTAPILAVALAVSVLWAVLLSFALSRSLVHPVTNLTETLDRLQSGEVTARLPVEGEDELARLAESHNRLADALAARNRSLQSVLAAVSRLSPREGVAALVTTAERATTDAFGFLRTRVLLNSGDTYGPSPEERVPGETYRLTVPMQVGDDLVGWLTAELIPTREWGPADNDLLTIFGSQLAAAIRSAELYTQTQTLSELKSEFLRGVTHNLQTPLTSIRAFAERLAADQDDRRLSIIVEQSERLSRLVDQLLTVSRLEAGTLRPEVDVFALPPLVRRAWESLGSDGHPFELHDQAAGWLAAADRDWADQVVWALLDNALKYGGDGLITVAVTIGRASEPHITFGPCLVTTVLDRGPGIAPQDRERVFERFVRLGSGSGDGTGLGLHVARGLAEAMGGALWLADCEGGAAFAFSLPAEKIEEG